MCILLVWCSELVTDSARNGQCKVDRFKFFHFIYWLQNPGSKILVKKLPILYETKIRIMVLTISPISPKVKALNPFHTLTLFIHKLKYTFPSSHECSCLSIPVDFPIKIIFTCFCLSLRIPNPTVSSLRHNKKISVESRGRISCRLPCMISVKYYSQSAQAVFY